MNAACNSNSNVTYIFGIMLTAMNQEGDAVCFFVIIFTHFFSERAASGTTAVRVGAPLGMFGKKKEKRQL